jgi:large subunit ribosomal protein L32e
MALKKRSHPKFNVPNYGAKKRSGVKARWRKQRGIDNKKRIKKRFMGAEPTIGYRNPESIRNLRASGRRAVLVHNVDELKEVISGMQESFDITVAGAVSARKRAQIVEVAKANGLHVTNGGMA